MKKIIFTSLWMLGFCFAGFIVFVIFIAGIIHLPPNADPASPEVVHKVQFIMLVDWLFPIGLPILALLLGIFGKLPGTRSRKDLVQI